MTYEFQNTLYRTPREVADAIAAEWLSAGGENGRITVEAELANNTDAELAEAAIDGWGLHEIYQHPAYYYEGQTWLEDRGLEPSDIERAFARLRAHWRERLFPQDFERV